MVKAGMNIMTRYLWWMLYFAVTIGAGLGIGAVTYIPGSGSMLW